MNLKSSSCLACKLVPTISQSINQPRAWPKVKRIHCRTHWVSPHLTPPPPFHVNARTLQTPISCCPGGRRAWFPATFECSADERHDCTCPTPPCTRPEGVPGPPPAGAPRCRLARPWAPRRDSRAGLPPLPDCTAVVGGVAAAGLEVVGTLVVMVALPLAWHSMHRSMMWFLQMAQLST